MNEAQTKHDLITPALQKAFAGELTNKTVAI